eukprot:CAMPEP_0174913896 /NCGR_PEP_ID=MMETSP0167-20121228/80559_1 /TAXON_ID=38298 /ORGANISM="Rhodella maculata, Strain CCMP736" /LENGTH=38 /DNA_ID= /DNA_START= /DNA_END= /DNA_ORIENTATION=
MTGSPSTPPFVIGCGAIIHRGHYRCGGGASSGNISDGK